MHVGTQQLECSKKRTGAKSFLEIIISHGRRFLFRSPLSSIMGLVCSRLSGVIKKKDVRVLLVGLDAAGKTTILYRLKLGESVNVIPTIGFNVEKVKYKKFRLSIWDTGGQYKIRPLWRHYYQDTQGIIFVIDSNDPKRLDEAREELALLLKQDDLRGAVLLILANKQDLPKALNQKEITDKFKLKDLQNRSWFVQLTCAKTGSGLHEGLDWLVDQLSHRS
ncbi:unnamed protein product [Calicophoron daubneyi]|uniref:ADP-ribosylation factor 4 n=1 Tax=Calicophoron daubneyi TaxID=300641 RepID=A0AAV2TMF6_CALDB